MLEDFKMRCGPVEDHGTHGTNGNDGVCLDRVGKGRGLAHPIPVARVGRQNGHGHGRGIGAHRGAWPVSPAVIATTRYESGLAVHARSGCQRGVRQCVVPAQCR